jgi:hypothetical protein
MVSFLSSFEAALVALVCLLLADVPLRQAHALAPSPFSDLLAADQYAAQARRAQAERLLLHPPELGLPVELLAPEFKLQKASKAKSKKTKMARGGAGGFGTQGVDPSKQWSKTKALAGLQKQKLQEDGVLRINGALSLEACQSLRAHVLAEMETTAALYEESILASEKQDPETPSSFTVEDYYGIEPGRSCRTDLLLSMTAPAVSAALQELFDEKDGKIRALYESLVTTDGIMYELAGVVTKQGSERQCVHPDVPFQSMAPLYVVFAALQDVTPDMGPTTFLRGSNTQAANTAFDQKGDAFDSFLSQQGEAVQSCLSTGDLVVFDARVLHCGNANESDTERALFNFSFRNPLVTGPMGYKGSMRPGYANDQMTLGDVLEVVDGGKSGVQPSESLFARYGNGLPY